MPNYGTTIKHGIRYLLGNNPVSDVDAGFKAMVDDIEAIMATDSQGTLAGRPATPKTGAYYYAEDVGTLYRGNGTTWIAVYARDPEPARYVGDTGQPGFATGYAATPGVGAGSLRFWKDQTGCVHLAGLASRTTAGAYSQVFTLPVGYRPVNGGDQDSGLTQSWIVSSGAGPTQCDISANGVVKYVTVTSGGTAGTCHFDGISFDPRR